MEGPSLEDVIEAATVVAELDPSRTAEVANMVALYAAQVCGQPEDLQQVHLASGPQTLPFLHMQVGGGVQEQQQEPAGAPHPAVQYVMQLSDEAFNNMFPTADAGSLAAYMCGLRTAAERNEALPALLPVLDIAKETEQPASAVVPLVWNRIKPSVHEQADAAAATAAAQETDAVLHAHLPADIYPGEAMGHSTCDGPAELSQFIADTAMLCVSMQATDGICYGT